MSAGNANTEGNKKNNFSWQKNVLLLLGKIRDNTTSLPGIDAELRITAYKANTNGVGYSTNDFISRTDIINVATGAIISTLWFNETTGLALAATPPIGDLNPYIPPSSVTVSNLPATLGQALMASSLSVVIASNQSNIPVTGNTGGFTAKIAIAPVTSATAYTANDNIGGIITLANAYRTTTSTGILESISLWALGNAAPNLYIDFWDASPSGTYTNDVAQVIAGDQLKWLGFAEIAVSDWKQTGVISRCSIVPPRFGLKANASTSIYMTIQDKTGVTLGSTAGLFGYVTILQD